MTDKISMDKKYEYVGKPFKLFTVTGTKKYSPVIGEMPDGCLFSFTEEGREWKGGPIALIEVRPSRWVNVYDNTFTAISASYTSKEEADRACWGAAKAFTRIACIEFKEGDGI